MLRVIKKLHLYGTLRKVCIFLINYIFVGMKPVPCAAKRALFRVMGFSVGKGTTIVGPVTITGNVSIGANCWINRGFSVYGNGYVTIGDCCDLGPDVTFLTGGHEIGSHERRAGKGQIYAIRIGDGCWIGAKTTILNNTVVEDGCVIAACACVTKSIPGDCLVGGVPARFIRSLQDEKKVEIVD